MQMRTDAITVTLGIYSGRPNPSLELSGPEAEELASLVKKAIEGEPSSPPPAAKLGRFYGFQVRTPPDLQKRLGLPPEFNVHSGVLSEKRGREIRHWRDVASLGQFLVGHALRRDYGQLLAKVGVETGPTK